MLVEPGPAKRLQQQLNDDPDWERLPKDEVLTDSVSQRLLV